MSETIETPAVRVRDTQQITTRTDSREILANARRDIERFKLNDYFIVDVDSHHVEFDSWAEVLDHIEDPVLRRNGKTDGGDQWPNAAQHRAQQSPAGPDVPGRPRTYPAPDPARRRRGYVGRTASRPHADATRHRDDGDRRADRLSAADAGDRAAPVGGNRDAARSSPTTAGSPAASSRTSRASSRCWRCRSATPRRACARSTSSRGSRA